MGYNYEIVNNNRIVRYLFRRMEQEKISIKTMAWKSGYTGSTISNWRYRSMPRIDSIEACLNVLGLTLAVVKKKDD